MNSEGDTKTNVKPVAEGGTDRSTDIDTSDKNTVTDTFLRTDAGVIFTNDRAGNIPTGILSTVVGSAALVALGIAGVAGGALYLKKKKSEEE